MIIIKMSDARRRLPGHVTGFRNPAVEFDEPISAYDTLRFAEWQKATA
jgi:hypothetical protein